MLSHSQMAASDSLVNRQLFHELKQKYPEVPDSIVTSYMIQHSNNKNKCLEVLAVESPKHMFGDMPTAPDASGAQVVQQMGDLAMDGQSARQRSDSGSSVKSNTSMGSLPSLAAGHVASLARAWPPAQPQQVGNSGQGSAAASHGDFSVMQKNSPVSPSELGKYIMQSQSTGQIPNIECNAHIAGHSESPHGSASHATVASNSASSNLNIMYHPQQRPHPQMALPPGTYGAQVSSDDHNMVSSGSVQKWISQTSANVSHNNSSAYSAGQFATHMMNSQQNCADFSPATTTVTTVPGHPQHLSQATIIIQNNKGDRHQVTSQPSQPSQPPQLPMHLPQIAVQPQLKIQQPQVSHPGAPIPVHHFISKTDQQMPQQAQHFSTTTAPRQSPQNDLHMHQQRTPYQHPTHSLSYPAVSGQQNVVSRPVIVQWQSSVPGSIQYNYQAPARPVGQSHIRLEVSPNSPTRATTAVDFSTPCNPPSLVYRPSFNPPDLPVRRDFMASGDIPTMSYPAQTTLHIPNYQTVSTTTKGRNSGGEPVDVNVMMMPNNYDMAQVMTGHCQPMQNMVMSPSSSHSSLSSETSQREGRSHRSGSLHEEPEYVQALLSHQDVQKSKLHNDLEKESRTLENLKGQVIQMESNMAQSGTTFPSLEDLTRLRDSNRKLLTEIQCMTREIDMYNNGRTPLGVVDPRDEQNFFKHLDQGPGNPLSTNVGMHPPHRQLPPGPQPSISSRPLPQTPPRTTPQTPPRTTPPFRTVKPLPPVPNITAIVPPAPPVQPHSSSGDSEEGDQWNCSACTFLNHPALNKCECCEMPRVTIGSR